MLIEILLFLLLGIIAGIFTGLLPGIHINLIGVFLITILPTSLGFIDPVYLIIFVVSMAITNTFVDFIPSIFLGCPDEDAELSVLPGHELLIKGHGYEAILLTAYGGLIAIFILILIVSPIIIIFSKIQNFLPIIIPWLLILTAIFMISTEKNFLKAILIFLLTGFLGLFVLNINFVKEPLLPLLTGLFGISSMLISIKTKTKIPDQEITSLSEKRIKPFFGSVIASLLCGFLPGVGGGQAAIVGNSITKTDRKGFLVLLGSTNVLVMSLSFIALYTISKSRTGAAATINNIIKNNLGSFSDKLLILILIIILLSGIISFFITKFLARTISLRISKINYNKLSIIIIIFIGILVLIISGIIGFLVLIISTLVGVYSINQKVKRTLMMGCLMIPTIVVYLF